MYIHRSTLNKFKLFKDGFVCKLVLNKSAKIMCFDRNELNFPYAIAQRFLYLS